MVDDSFVLSEILLADKSYEKGAGRFAPTKSMSKSRYHSHLKCNTSNINLKDCISFFRKVSRVRFYF